MKGLQENPEHNSGVDLQEARRPIVELDTPALLVDRQRLIQFVPGWANEQLLNPVPGRLRVTFRVQ